MQPTESNQHTAVNSRQTLQGTDMDIKELAPRIAYETDVAMVGVKVDPMARRDLWDIDFATRLIAAYLKEQEPVSLYPCGFKELKSLVIKHGAYLARGMNEDEPVTESIRSSAMVLVGYAKDMSDLLAKQPLFTAPPEPAPQMPLGVSEGTATSACAAPSSEEVREADGYVAIERDEYGDAFMFPDQDSLVVNQTVNDRIVKLQDNDLPVPVFNVKPFWFAPPLPAIPAERIATLEQQRDELLAALEPFADIQHYSLAPNGAGFAMRSNGEAVTYGQIRAAKAAIAKVKP